MPSMNDSLEVKVLYPAGWRRRISEAQGRHREMRSGQSSASRIRRCDARSVKRWTNRSRRSAPCRSSSGSTMRARQRARCCDRCSTSRRGFQSVQNAVGRRFFGHAPAGLVPPSAIRTKSPKALWSRNPTQRPLFLRRRCHRPQSSSASRFTAGYGCCCASLRGGARVPAV
jgi:hypothetical protein